MPASVAEAGKNMQTRRQAFTLIELLVVIAIIAILAAILFPVFVNAKRSALVTTCGSRAKQMGVAMLRYMDDYNGSFPWAGTANLWPHNTAQPPPLGQGGKYKSCSEPLLAYSGKNKEMLFCPLWKSSMQSKYWPTIDWSWWYFCAHTNPYVQRNPGSELCGYRISNVRKPSWKPSLVEINAPHDQYDGNGNPLVGQTQLYCDGHVKCVYGTYGDVMKAAYRSRNGPP